MIFYMQRLIFIIFGLLTLSGLTATGANWNSRVWRSDDGLLDNKVVGVQQSSDGFLWVATARGVMRFDGLDFKPLPVTEEFASSGKITALFIDSLDRLWVTQQRGEILCVDHGSGVIKMPSQSNGKLVAPPSIVEEEPGRILFCFPNGLVFCVVNGKVEKVPEEREISNRKEAVVKDGLGQIWFSQGGQGIGMIQEGRFCPLETFRVDRLGGARSGGLWICSGNELWKYSEEGHLERIDNLPQELWHIPLTAFHEDRWGGLWIGSDGGGLFYFDGHSFERTPLLFPMIASLDEDRDGNIWVGTGEGLNLLTPVVVNFLRSSKERPYKNAFSVAQETNGTFWVVWSRGLISKSLSSDLFLAPADGEWSVRDAQDVPLAQCVVADPTGGVWFGTETNGLYRWKDGAVVERFGTERGLAASNVSALHITREGDVWVGTKSAPSASQFYLQVLRSGVFLPYPLPPDSKSVVALASDDEGHCWFATYDGRLFCADRDGKMEEKTALLSPVPYGIFSLCFTPDRSLWIGFAGQGLGRLKNGRFSRYRMEQGLHENFISRILFDKFGRLWFAGHSGIVRVAIQDFDEVDAGRFSRVQSIVYGKNEGLLSTQSTDFFWPGAICDNAGRLLFGLKGGLAVIRPGEAGEPQTQTRVAIERVNVDGRTLAKYAVEEVSSGSAYSRPVELWGQGQKRLRIPPGANHVEISFTAPGFRFSESAVFRCRLKGLGSQWNDVGAQRSVSYYGIRPGDYQFEVIARNSDGIWSEKGTLLGLTLEPYWWETGWFRIGGLLIVFGGLMFGTLFVLRHRQKLQIERLEFQQAMEKERTRIAADLHDDMGSNLAQIGLLCQRAKKDLANPVKVETHLNMALENSSLLSEKLDAVVWAVNPANDTLEVFIDYLGEYAQEFLTLADIRLRFIGPDVPPSVTFPSFPRHQLFLAVKEALHNVKKHACAKQVTLRVQVDETCLTVEVEDDGKGISPEHRKQMGADGLGNMVRRMEALHGSFECLPGKDNRGTRIIFKLPLSCPERE
jgi:signal transduction histidine kinase/ligand-binding sensor domain-containing protein